MFNPPYWYYDNVKFSDIEIINLKTDLFGSEKTEEMSKIVDYVNSLGLNIPKLKIDPVRQISTYHYDMDNKPDNIFKERYDVIVEDILKSVGFLKTLNINTLFGHNYTRKACYMLLIIMERMIYLGFIF